MILSSISLLITGLFLLIVLSALLAPLESLGWWAGWYGESLPPWAPAQSSESAAPESAEANFLVYLSGIGAIDAGAIPQEEIDWGRMALRRLPDTTVVGEVFPYSVATAGLTAAPLFSKAWHWIAQRRLRNPGDLLQYAVNLRNLFQVAISADRRYGPIYNLGVAGRIIRALQARGYTTGSGTPVTLVGYSGGGQIALGAATFLRPLLKAPLRVISIGGVLSDDVGLGQVTRLYHLYGERDSLQGVGALLYAGRWPWFPRSLWNKAHKAGRIRFVCLGPVAHNGPHNYFSWTARTRDGRSHAVATIDAIGDILLHEGLIDPHDLQAARVATAAEVEAYEAARLAEAEPKR